MNGFRFLAVSILSLSASLATAATGRITDAVTGEPISGASIYAVWYYKAIQLPLPIESPAGGRACGGAAIVKTDAYGEYDLGIWMNWMVELHDSALWISAPGHFDVQQANATRRFWGEEELPKTKIQGTPSGSKWSRAMVPLKNESTNTRLLGLASAGGPEP